jgi:phage terminase large subunit
MSDASLAGPVAGAVASGTARIAMPPKLIPVFQGPARYRGAYGGRGSGKSRTFAKMSAVSGYLWSMTGEEGIILCGREYMNSLEESSMAEVKAAIRSEPWLDRHYDIGETFIRTRCGRIEYCFTGLRHSLDSIKSKARIKLLWVDEAEPVSETAWQKAIPSVREHGSEIWVTWNPERKASATHRRFREHAPIDAQIVELNWRDNPYFPEVLRQARLEDRRLRPDSYAHIWEGDFVSVVEGAYYASPLTEAKLERRIGGVGFDPLLPVRLYCDLGGAGARSDAFAMWPAQFVGREIRVRDYYEAQGQPLAAHLAWLRTKGYGPDRAQFWLPHDGATSDRVYAVSYESALREAGYEVTIVPNQGRGAAAARIEAVRRLFPSIWFDEETTGGGRDALGWYHERKDATRSIGLGPVHDWSSHAADAFGLMCIAYEPPSTAARRIRGPNHPDFSGTHRRSHYPGADAWMG